MDMLKERTLENQKRKEEISWYTQNLLKKKIK